MEPYAKSPPWIPGAVLITMMALVGYAFIRQNVNPVPSRVGGILVEETTTMIAWTSNGIRIEVYRRDYDSDQEWQDAAAALMKIYPPDQN